MLYVATMITTMANSYAAFHQVPGTVGMALYSQQFYRQGWWYYYSHLIDEKSEASKVTEFAPAHKLPQ